MADKTVSDFLGEIFESLRKKNPKYSLRAFARDSGLSPTTVSQLLSGKAKLSPSRAESVAMRLQLDRKECEVLRLLSEIETARSERKRKVAMLKRLRHMSPFDGQVSDNYRLIADWYHLPICELTELPGFRSDAVWIADQLGITAREASSAVARLVRLGLLIRKNGVLRKTQSSVVVSMRPYSKELRQSHRDFIRLALRAMDRQKPSERYFSSTVIRCRSEDVSMAWSKLRESRQKLMLDLESGKGQDAVYALGIQFFRLAPRP